MQIRKCTQADIVATGAFYDKVVEYLLSHTNYPKWTKEYPSESWVWTMSQDESQYICVEDGNVIGAFVFNTDPQGSYYKVKWGKTIPEREYMILHTLAIDPELQGKGLGSEVVKFCLEEAKTRGYKAVRVDVVPGNLPAARLYEKNGFTYVGDADLDRGIDYIPVFQMYEYNF